MLKPAEATPLNARAIFEVFHDSGVPPGVINMVTASDPVPIGETFTSDPRVVKLTFTGAAAVGRTFASAAGASLKRISVELGGHAPFIVMPDADPVHAAKGVAALKFLNAGQACIGPNRIYVHPDAVEQFTETMAERVGRVRTGNGAIEGIGCGPIVNEAAVAKVEAQVNDAVGRGATAVVGVVGSLMVSWLRGTSSLRRCSAASRMRCWSIGKRRSAPLPRSSPTRSGRRDRLGQ